MKLLLKLYQRYKDKIKFNIDINIATFFEFLIELISFPFIANIEMAPNNGKKVIKESIGKFIKILPGRLE